VISDLGEQDRQIERDWRGQDENRGQMTDHDIGDRTTGWNLVLAKYLDSSRVIRDVRVPTWNTSLEYLDLDAAAIQCRAELHMPHGWENLGGAFSLEQGGSISEYCSEDIACWMKPC
jgi:hypothetical protein